MAFGTQDRDEEERLLTPTSPRKVKLPKIQVAVLLIAYFTQPIACTVIYPFIAKLVEELDLVDGDYSKIGYYSGIFDALPLICEACSILYWTRLGENYGRRRVLLFGALGVAFSLTAFGVSKTLPALVISRALQGALNANSSTIKTMMGEITEGDETAMARAFSFLPTVWAVGSTLAPLLGGTLQHPAERFPSLFTAPVWKEYPYLLPCLAAASVPTCAFFAILVFLKNTNRPLMEKQHEPECEERNTSYGTMQSAHPTLTRQSSVSSTRTLQGSTHSNDSLQKRHGFYWTRTLVITLLNYAILVLLTSAFYALISTFLATPIPNGGLGLEPAVIGVAVATLGVFHGTFQAFFFAPIHARVDPKKLLRTSMVAFAPLYALMPIMNWAARIWGVGWVVGGMICLQSLLCMVGFMGFCCMYIFVTRAAPNPESLAKTNGLSQMVYSICGAAGPALGTILFAVTEEYRILGGYLIYVVMVGLSMLGMFLSTYLPSRHEMPM